MTVIKQWENKYQKQISKNYQYHIKTFLASAYFIIEQANYSDIINYIEQLRKLGSSIYIIKNRLFAIKFYYNCLQEFGYIRYHPCPNLVLQDKLDKQKPIANFYTSEEFTTFLERKESKKIHLDIRNKIIKQFLVFQGITITEIVNLEVQNIDLEKGTITLKESYLNARKLALEASQLLILHNYITGTRSQFLKGNSSNLLLLSTNGKKIPAETINGMLNKGFTKKFMPKRIRQSVIINLLKKGNDLRAVQIFAGYKEITTVENYKQNDIAVLQKAIQTNHPLG